MVIIKKEQEHYLANRGIGIPARTGGILFLWDTLGQSEYLLTLFI